MDYLYFIFIFNTSYKYVLQKAYIYNLTDKNEKRIQKKITQRQNPV